MDTGPNFLAVFKGEPNVVELKAGEVLFKAGDPSQHMFAVLSGTVRISDGEIVYEEVAPGGIVGEMALIDHEPRSATVSAVTDCSLAKIDEQRFLFLIHRTPIFALDMMRLLTFRLRKMDALTKETRAEHSTKRAGAR
jgi:CRP-like cAMP-binding protein